MITIGKNYLAAVMQLTALWFSVAGNHNNTYHVMCCQYHYACRESKLSSCLEVIMTSPLYELMGP